MQNHIVQRSRKTRACTGTFLKQITRTSRSFTPNLPSKPSSSTRNIAQIQTRHCANAFQPLHCLEFRPRRVQVHATHPRFSHRFFSSKVQTLLSKKSTLRRVLFNVPGSEQKKIDKSMGLDLDCVVLDLEDGVAINQKNQARNLVRENLLNSRQDHRSNPSQWRFGRAERLVRINALGSGLEMQDLQETIRPLILAGDLDAIVVPKVESASHLSFIANFCHSYESGCMLPNKEPVGLLAAIESPNALINLKEICQDFGQQFPGRLKALIFASEDFVASAGMTRTPSAKELLYARSAVATHASAFGIQSIDMVCLDFKNSEILTAETLEGIQMGFTGKQAIHPNQIQPIYQTFYPDPKKLDFAKRILEENEKFQAEGKGAFSLDGKMIDMPMVKWARVIADRAR